MTSSTLRLVVSNGCSHSAGPAPRQHTQDDKPLAAVDPASGYYATTTIVDHAINVCLNTARNFGPAILPILAFTSPHFPLQTPAEDIARYHGRYLKGWDVLRQERWHRMRALGIGGSALSPVERDLGPPYPFPEAIKKLGPNEVNLPLPWSDLTSNASFRPQRWRLRWPEKSDLA